MICVTYFTTLCLVHELLNSIDVHAKPEVDPEFSQRDGQEIGQQKYHTLVFRKETLKPFIQAKENTFEMTKILLKETPLGQEGP